MINEHERKLDPSEISPEILRQIENMVHAGHASLVGPDGEKIALPPALNDMFVFIVEAMKRQQTIFLMPSDETFTTQAAANFLGVSRPYLLRLLEADRIPFHRVGTHRRIVFRDLIGFQHERSKVRNAVLSELTKEMDEAGVYDRFLEPGA